MVIYNILSMQALTNNAEEFVRNQLTNFEMLIVNGLRCSNFKISIGDLFAFKTKLIFKVTYFPR